MYFTGIVLCKYVSFTSVQTRFLPKHLDLFAKRKRMGTDIWDKRKQMIKLFNELMRKCLYNTDWGRITDDWVCRQIICSSVLFNFYLNVFLYKFTCQYTEVCGFTLLYICNNLDFHISGIMHSKIDNMYFYFFSLFTCLYYIYWIGYTALLSYTAGLSHSKHTMNVLLSLLMMCFTPMLLKCNKYWHRLDSVLCKTWCIHGYHVWYDEQW